MDTAPHKESASCGVEVFVPGRICLFGEHSDWAGGYRRFNADVSEGLALCCGTTQGLYATAKKLPDKRIVIFRSHDGSSCELPVDDMKHLKAVALSASKWAYIAGTILEIGKHFRVGGAEINNYKTDLPLKKGLSSSAAVCVMVARALNQLYDLKLTVHGEMDIAYRGEINTPSRCGRLDQCVAFGQCVTQMGFDGDLVAAETVRVAAPLYLVVVDLCAGKDTKEILKCLNEAYPYARGDSHKALHSLLGEENLKVCTEAVAALGKERDPTEAARRIGELMTQAQARWDAKAVPLCPHELKAPALHKLLECRELAPLIFGGKGVGSQGDGSAQLVCKNEEAQTAAMKVVTSLGMDPLRLTIQASKAVRTAVIPVAGFCGGMWPCTKVVGPWLFPMRGGDAVKPAICWLCEELIAAGMERIVLVVNEVTEAQMRHLFEQREDVGNLSSVATASAEYDEELLAIGRRIVFVRQPRPSGILDAVLLCEEAVRGEPFVLAWGDHLCYTTAPGGLSCVGQLLAHFDGSRSVAALNRIGEDRLYLHGVFQCLVPPASAREAANGEEEHPVCWPITRVAEKPTRSFAESHLATPGLGENEYLGSFGQYVLMPSIFQVLRGLTSRHFVDALDEMRQKEGLDGAMIQGRRYDLGAFENYVEALQLQAGGGMRSDRKRTRASSPTLAPRKKA